MDSVKEILSDLKTKYSELIRQDAARKETFNQLVHKFKELKASPKISKTKL
jgi:hypothetical protein